MLDNKPILEMKDIVKSFNKVEVLHNVNFSLLRGEVHAVVGQNGAGKSTLMKIISGVYAKDSGTIEIEGKEVEYNSAKDAKKCGISMVFQEFSLIPTLTVSQNIFLTRELYKISKFLLDDRQMEGRTTEILNNLGVYYINPKETIERLSISSRQLVEIAKAFSSEPKILILDEPTASLSSKETGSLFRVIDKLKRKGISIIYISHYLKEIFEVCDQVTALRDGYLTFNEQLKKTSLEEVIDSMVGEKTKKYIYIYRKKKEIDRDKKPLLEVKDIANGKLLKGISFKLWPGEILGIAGLLGSGRSEIVNTIFGISKKGKGDIYINGKKVNIKHAKNAIQSGISMVPEDRRTKGLILDFTIRDNMLLPIIYKLTKLFFVNDRKGNQVVKKYINKLNIKTTGIWQTIKFLSGGNQQKVVVAKSIASDSKILLLDDATFGIDVKSKQEMMDIVCKFVDTGNAAIFISSELEEIANYCDRVIILKKGKIINVIDSRKDSEISEEKLLKLIQ